MNGVAIIAAYNMNRKKTHRRVVHIVYYTRCSSCIVITLIRSFGLDKN